MQTLDVKSLEISVRVLKFVLKENVIDEIALSVTKQALKEIQGLIKMINKVGKGKKKLLLTPVTDKDLKAKRKTPCQKTKGS